MIYRTGISCSLIGFTHQVEFFVVDILNYFSPSLIQLEINVLKPYQVSVVTAHTWFIFFLTLL